jgi:mRNA interferase RelE/StbE
MKMTSEIFFSSKAMSYLQSLDKQVKLQILKRVSKLGLQPNLGVPLTNNLKGCFKLRVSKYRIIYAIEKSSIIIAKIGHRKDVY